MAGDDMLPKGRLVRVELEILLPVDAPMQDIDNWIGLQFGVAGLRSGSPLTPHSPEPFGEVMLTDTGQQGARVETNLRRSADGGIAYSVALRRWAADAPREPAGRIAWITPEGAGDASVVDVPPTIVEMTARMLGDLDWVDVTYEGKPGRLFHAKPWKGGARPNRVASDIAGTAIVGDALLYLPEIYIETKGAGHAA